MANENREQVFRYLCEKLPDYFVRPEDGLQRVQTIERTGDWPKDHIEFRNTVSFLHHTLSVLCKAHDGTEALENQTGKQITLPMLDIQALREIQAEYYNLRESLERLRRY
jgi:hypothetical protein